MSPTGALCAFALLSETAVTPQKFSGGATGALTTAGWEWVVVLTCAGDKRGSAGGRWTDLASPDPDAKAFPLRRASFASGSRSTGAGGTATGPCQPLRSAICRSWFIPWSSCESEGCTPLADSGEEAGESESADRPDARDGTTGSSSGEERDVELVLAGRAALALLAPRLRVDASTAGSRAGMKNARLSSSSDMAGVAADSSGTVTRDRRRSGRRRAAITNFALESDRRLGSIR